MRCCAPFTFLVNSRRRCGDCAFNVCKSCCSYQKHEKVWVCCVCQQARWVAPIFLPQVGGPAAVIGQPETTKAGTGGLRVSPGLSFSFIHFTSNVIFLGIMPDAGNVMANPAD